MIKKTTYEEPEKAISALESELGLRITVIDYEGLFHTIPGQAVLDYNRQSHRKLPSCFIDFCNDKCIGHCRHWMNSECLRRREPFINTCWKGIKQIVIPLRFEGRHCGMLYAGNWKSGAYVPQDLSKEFYEAYDELDDFPEERCDRLIRMLDFFAKGLTVSLNEFGALNAPATPRAARIASFIRTRAAGNIQLPDLAQYLEVSNSRASVLVNKLLGCSFTTLLNEERIRRAKAMLLSSEEKVKDIAVKVGYNDEYHFNRIFHKYEGLPPGEFRQQYLSK